MGQYAYLVCVDGSGNHNKYYEAKENDDGSIDVKYGRVGKNPQTHHYEPWEKHFSSLVWEKERKGYRDITSTLGQATAEKFKDMDDKDTESFLQNFYEKCRQIVRQNYVGGENVTDEQLRRANMCLTAIAGIRDAVKSRDSMNGYGFLAGRQINAELSNLFSIVPRIMDKVSDKMISLDDYMSVDKAVNEINKVLSREQDLLDTLKTAKAVAKPENDKTVMEACGITMRIADYEDEDKIKAMMIRSEDKSESLVKIFSVDNKETRARYDKCKKDLNITSEKLLFHGSGEENWFSIMRNGMSLKPNAQITGKGLGDGLYFADDVVKSLNYCRGSSRYIGVFAVATGNEERITRYSQAPDNVKGLRKGKDSIFLDASDGHTNGSGLNEICVYREGQADIRYIIECQKVSRDVRFSLRLSLPFTDKEEKKDTISATAELSDYARKELAKIGITTADVEGVYDLKKDRFDLVADGERVKLTDDERDRLCRDFKKSFFKNEYEWREHKALPYAERTGNMKSFGKGDVAIGKKKTEREM